MGILALVLLLAGGAAAATLTVDASGGADYTRIQDAINASSAGDTILVYSGTYYENVNVNKQLILKGIDTGNGIPVINAKGSGSAVTLIADGITLEGFSATNSGSQPSLNADAGINIISDYNILLNNTANSNNFSGIYLNYSKNNVLRNNTASNNKYAGINLYSSSNNILSANSANLNKDFGIILYPFSNNNTMSGSDAYDNGVGIFLGNSNNNSMSNNKMLDNHYNFGVESDSSYNNDINISNTVNGKPIYYLQGASDAVYNAKTNAGTFYCINCNNITVKDLTLANNMYGIVFWNADNSKLENINASNNIYGISLISSSSNNTLGINIANSNYNYGIVLFQNSNNNTLSGNNISNNGKGIYLYNSNNNSIYNNFFNNTNNFGNGNSVNRWNASKTLGTNIVGGPYLSGNFWANPNGTGFSQTCTDADGDGICDSPYMLDSNNIDYLPLSMNFTYNNTTKGDVNGDGNANIVDALFIAQYTVGSRTLTPAQLAAADVNCDGNVNIVDALFIAQYTVGIRPTFC